LEKQKFLPAKDHQKYRGDDAESADGNGDKQEIKIADGTNG
jgi:hypothetical protein